MSTNNDMDQATDKAMQDAGSMAKKAGSGAKKIGGKFGKKAGKALVKAGIKAIKMLGALIMKIIGFGWPVLLIIAGGLLAIVLIDHFFNEIRGYSQDYDYQVQSQNDYKQVTNEYGDQELLSLSEENAFLQILYEEESKNSYWKYYEKNGKINLDYGTDRKKFSTEVKDKYKRENYFLLTAMNLYAIEEYLHDNVIYSPQTFVQHVPFKEGDDGRLEGIPLVDEDGKLNVKSQKYIKQDEKDKDGGTVYRKAYDGDKNPLYTEGVWDYGLSPVYHYKEFTEEYETRNRVTGAQIWDIDKQAFREMTSNELSEFESEGKPLIYKEYEKEYDKSEKYGANQNYNNIQIVEEHSTQHVWMIQDAVTPMGTIKNEIEQNWEQTNNVTHSTQTLTTNVPVEHTRIVQKETESGDPLWYALNWEGRYVRNSSVLNNSGMMGGPSIDYGNGNYKTPPRRNPTTPSRPQPTTRPRPSSGSGVGQPAPIREETPRRSYYGWNVNPTTSEFKGYSLPESPNLKIPAGYKEGQIINDSKTSASHAPDGWHIQWKWKPTKTETTTDTGDSYKVMVDEIYYLLEPKEHIVELTGYEWEYVPKYVGEPDTSELTGLDYYQQYFENYNNYITKDNYPSGKIDELKIELPPTPTDEDGKPLHEEDDWLKSFDATTPSEMLQLAKLDELRNLKYYHDPQGNSVLLTSDVANTGTVKGLYDVPLTVEERLAGETKSGFFHKEHPVMKAVRDKQVEHELQNQGVGASLNLEGINFGEESNSDVVQRASENLDLFVKYGEMYGMDPMLLLAISAQESGGSHYAIGDQANSNGVRRGYTYKGGGLYDAAAVGLMQVMPLHNGNLSYRRDVSAFNHITGAMERDSATVEELHDLEKNIKIGTMILASEMKNAGDDIFVGLSSYQFGIAYSVFIRDNGYGTWSPEADKAYIASGRSGDLNYIPFVMRYYLPTEDAPFPYIINSDGERISYDVDGIDFATDSLVDLEVTQSVSNRARSIHVSNYPLEDFMNDLGRSAISAGTWIIDGLVKGTKTVGHWLGFTDDPNIDTTDYYKIGHNLSASEARLLIYKMMSYEDGVYLSEYEKMTDEDFEEKFMKLFVQDVRQQQGMGMAINPDDFFPDGYQSPVDNVDITVAYNEEHGNKSFHGIQLAVPGGAEVYVVADGKISKLTANELEVDHGDDVYTSYRFVGDMNLKAGGYKVGDDIKKGVLIGRGSKDDGFGNFTKDGSFAFSLRNPVQVDPTWIVDPSALGGYGDLGIDPNSGTFQNPYYGKTFTWNSNYSKSRLSPTFGVYMPHVGTDMAGSGAYYQKNTELGAVADGVVEENAFNGRNASPGVRGKGLGWYIVIRHDDVEVKGGGTMWSLYAHLVEQSPLTVGTKVRRGQAVGKEGTTGGSTGDHLHLEFIAGHGSSGTAVKNADQVGNTFDPRPHLE